MTVEPIGPSARLSALKSRNRWFGRRLSTVDAVKTRRSRLRKSLTHKYMTAAVLRYRP